MVLSCTIVSWTEPSSASSPMSLESTSFGVSKVNTSLLLGGSLHVYKRQHWYRADNGRPEVARPREGSVRIQLELPLSCELCKSVGTGRITPLPVTHYFYRLLGPLCFLCAYLLEVNLAVHSKLERDRTSLLMLPLRMLPPVFFLVYLCCIVWRELATRPKLRMSG